MRRLGLNLMAGALGSVAMVAASGAANASPCGTTTLDNWLASGFSCTVGNNTFSSFIYLQGGFNGMNGISDVPATSVGVAATTSDPAGIEFDASWTNAGATRADALIFFTVTAPVRTPITKFALQLGGVDGNVLAVPSLSNGVTVASSDNLLHTADFAPITTLLVTDQIAVNPGGTISSIEKRFTNTEVLEVPEPATLAILGVGLLGLAAHRSRRETM